MFLPALNLFTTRVEPFIAPLTLAVLGILACGVLSVMFQIKESSQSKGIGTSTHLPFPEALFSENCGEARRGIRIMQTYIPGTTPVPDGLAITIKAWVPVPPS